MKSKLKNINSNTGKFIDGNPTSGELGTIVTAEWLNGVQERVQDIFEELKNVLVLANLQPDGNKTTQVADAILAYVQTFNLKIESNTRSLANVIPNSKKSSAVNSNSADTVATSAAVKIAYDKGVEAKTAADGAQRTANDGVSKADAAQRTANDGVSKATTAQNTANSAVTKADGAQRTADDGVSKATTAQNTANSAVTKADNAQRAADNANNNANNRVSKSGDTMMGNLVIKNGSPWSSVVLDNNQGQGIKLESRPNDDVFMGEISYLDIHNGYRNINTLLLPKKSGALALEADVNGKAPLSDFETVKNNYYNKFGFAERAYPSHYNGAHVWTMRFNQFGGLRIIQLRAEIKNSSGTVPIYLPEEMTTQSLSIATDDGYIRYSYGSKVTSNNIVTVYTPQNKTVGINLFVIGWVNF